MCLEKRITLRTKPLGKRECVSTEDLPASGGEGVRGKVYGGKTSTGGVMRQVGSSHTRMAREVALEFSMYIVLPPYLMMARIS